MLAKTFIDEDREARILVRDLHKTKPAIYWADLLITAALGWSSLAFGVMVTPLSGAMWIACAVAVFSLYRGLCFVHEVSHHGIPHFETAWNFLFGFPLLIPSSAYAGMHQGHHSLATYGTAGDPEYLPFARSSGMTVVFAIESFLIPVILAIRFLVLTPFGFLFPPFYRWLVVHLSSLTMNVAYRRPFSRDLLQSVQLQNAGILIFWSGLLAVAYTRHMPWRFFAVWLGVSSVVSFINTLRTLGAHSYESKGDPLDREGQLADSIDTPGAFWTELWAPVGLRYHALHHYFPGIPYHNLPEAWRRLSAELDHDALYHQMSSPSLPRSLAALYQKGRRSNALRHR